MGDVKTSGSLRLRLVAILIATGAVMALMLVLVFQTFAKQIATDAQDSQLLASATSILESATLDDGELLVDIPYSALSMLGFVSEDRVFYHIALNDEFLSGYEDLVSLPLQEETAFKTAAHLGAEVRIVSTSRLVGTGANSSTLSVSVAQTQDGIEQRLAVIYRRAIGIGLGFFVIASLLSFFVSYRVLRPLERLAVSVQRRGPGDLTPIRQVVPDEMASLVGSLNAFTSRLRRALSSSEEFITEAAHRIRTPLATVRTQAELLIRRSKNSKNRQTLRSLIQAVDETSRTSSQLLDHAMVNLRSDALKKSKVNLAEFVQELVDRIKPIAELRDIDIKVQTRTSKILWADPVLLERAFSNILDNSLKYSPEESEIIIAVKEHANTIEISVSDQGSGFPKEKDILLDRFQRGIAAQGTVGSGLGLTIARDVVAVHDGQIELKNKKGGGACVSILLPV